MSTSPTPDRRRLLRHLLIVLIMVVFAYLVAVTVSMLVGDQQKQSEIDRVGGTRITWTPQTDDDAPLSAAELNRAERVFTSRLKARGIKNAEVGSEGDTIVIGVPGGDADALNDLGQRRQLSVRPVLESLPTELAATTAPGTERPGPDVPRQTTDPILQRRVFQEHARHCGQDDPLAGRDDPALPLVTCSADATEAYLLGPAIFDGEQIERASAGFDPNAGGNVVEIVLTPQGKTTWARFTAEHIGTATAFVQDSAVLSAPVIREAIPGGRIQISGQFTTGAARDLAAAINQGPLPVGFTPSRTEHLDPTPASSNFSSPEFGLIAGGFVLMIALIGGLVFVMARERS